MSVKEAKFEIKRCASCATTSFPGFFLYFERKDPGNEVECATFLLLPHFDVIWDLLLNRRAATWNLFVNSKPLESPSEKASSSGLTTINVPRADPPRN